MKKLIMTAAVVACAASIVSAQTVTSANIVGYNKAELGAGKQIFSYQFDYEAIDKTVQSVYGDKLPVGTKVYVYDGGYATPAEYKSSFGSQFWQNGTLNLGGNLSHWVEVPSGSYTNVFSGEVLIEDSVTNSIVPGLQLISWPYPTDVAVEDLGYTPTVGDKVWVYGSGGYATPAEYKSSFGSTFWQNGTLTISQGGGFWYDSASSTTNEWVAFRPFNID